MSGAVKRGLEEVIEALPAIGKIAVLVGTVAITVAPGASWAYLVLQIGGYIVGGDYLRKAAPDGMLPELLQTGTAGVIPKKIEVVADKSE